ncbi:MAG: HAD-IIA family hydrolase [Acidimicrobiales bacterium]
MWVLDLDGVVWLGERALEGAADAVAELRAGGHQVVFATNNSSPVVGEQEAKLARLGIPARGDVVTSATAAAALVAAGERVLVCGGPGMVEAMEARGAEVVDATIAARAGATLVDAVDAVAVGFDPYFDYERLTASYRAVRAGARFIASNDDPTYPTPEGPIPGGGAIVASVERATGVTPVVAGKPHRPMAELILSRADGGEAGIMVGDRPSTDGEFATTLGFRFALVLTGVTSQDDLPVSPSPDLVAEDLATLVTRVLHH